MVQCHCLGPLYWEDSTSSHVRTTEGSCQREGQKLWVPGRFHRTILSWDSSCLFSCSSPRLSGLLSGQLRCWLLRAPFQMGLRMGVLWVQPVHCLFLYLSSIVKVGPRTESVLNHKTKQRRHQREKLSPPAGKGSRRRRASVGSLLWGSTWCRRGGGVAVPSVVSNNVPNASP